MVLHQYEVALSKPPLCKGRWHGASRDGGIGKRRGAATTGMDKVARHTISIKHPLNFYTQGRIIERNQIGRRYDGKGDY